MGGFISPDNRPRFTIGEAVKFKVGDVDPGIVTGIVVKHSGFAYNVRWSEDLVELTHEEIELAEDSGFSVPINTAESN
jgi:hypothetical protein